MMQVLLLLLVGIYGLVMLRFWRAWKQIPQVILPENYFPQTSISVIIPVRNEADSITSLLQQLKEQNYPPHLLEVLVIDDHSEDDTATLVNLFGKQLKLNLTLIQLDAKKSGSGKKAAIKLGVAAASGELLVFTDGDCQVQPNWIANLEYVYTSKKAKFISGPVCFNNTKGLFQKMQLVEFAGLIGVGGSSIYLYKPNMCNGANLAYPKSIFEEVNGFVGNEHVASGDDEFLMHKVHERYPEDVYFVKAADAIVYTAAKAKFSEFFSQRMRWAGKWPAYTKLSIKALALLVFGLNFLLFIGAIMVIKQQLPIKVVALAFGLKFLVDFVFLHPVLAFFGKRNYLWYALPLQVLNIPYVVITALMGLKGSYSWKGRQVTNTRPV